MPRVVVRSGLQSQERLQAISNVSLDSADRNQLRLSARLLAVAAQVQPRRKE